MGSHARRAALALCSLSRRLSQSKPVSRPYHHCAASQRHTFEVEGYLPCSRAPSSTTPLSNLRFFDIDRYFRGDRRFSSNADGAGVSGEPPGAASTVSASPASTEIEAYGEALPEDVASPPQPEDAPLVDEISDEFFAKLQVSDEELDSAILMRDVTGIPGLPPLDELLAPAEDDEREKRRARERAKQEEYRQKRVVQIDELGRAYATGRRKTSSARVWIKPGAGEFRVNGRPVDLYFPDLHVRADLLQPFLVTQTLGAFEVTATVRGGGVSGQAGAIRHGISRALQNYNPDLRPPLKLREWGPEGTVTSRHEYSRCHRLGGCCSVGACGAPHGTLRGPILCCFTPRGTVLARVVADWPRESLTSDL